MYKRKGFFSKLGLEETVTCISLSCAEWVGGGSFPFLGDVWIVVVRVVILGFDGEVEVGCPMIGKQIDFFWKSY